MGSASLVSAALQRFQIELLAWGFAGMGTRFGKFHQDSARSTIEEIAADASQAHSLTGVCPTLALYVLWDLPDENSISALMNLSARFGVLPGSVNPNVFQDCAADRTRSDSRPSGKLNYRKSGNAIRSA